VGKLRGAFPSGPLRGLDNKELVRDGVIGCGARVEAVAEEVAALMNAAGQNESEEEPRVPLAARRLRVPFVRAAQ
jgi:hypothetical protein